MKKALYVLGLLLPWAMRRRLLNAMFGYQIHPTSRIGFAWILPDQLVMGAHSEIAAFTVCKGLRRLELGESAGIGRGNWISGFPANRNERYSHQSDRQPDLIVGDHAAITSRHIIDCTDKVSIGAFSTVAGFRSQLVTHSIDLENNRQSSAPITIGNYAFIGTNCVLLGGCTLPDHSVLGAKSLLNKKYSEPFWLYTGTPARPTKRLDGKMQYFTRQVGCVF